MKLNNRGFTLIEILAVLVIISIIGAIMTPTITKVLQQNKEKSYNNLLDSIKNSAKVYISDNRYEIEVSTCTGGSANITKIGTTNISGSKIPLNLISANGALKDEIKDPRDSNKKLNLVTSTIKVTFNCNSKKFKFETPTLVWS